MLKTEEGDLDIVIHGQRKIKFGKIKKTVAEILKLAGVTVPSNQFKNKIYHLAATDGNKTITVKTKNEKVVLFLTKFNSEKEQYRFLKQIVKQCDKCHELEIKDNHSVLFATISWSLSDGRDIGLLIV